MNANGLQRVGLRYLLRRRWQSLFMVFGIALGVAVMVAIDLANVSAERAFTLSSESVTGKATDHIVGGPEGIDEQVYFQLRRSGMGIDAAPVINEYVASPQLGGQPLQLLGLDPFVDAPFRNYLNPTIGEEAGALQVFLTRPGAVLIAAGLAEAYGLEVGDSFELEISGRLLPVSLAGVLSSTDDLTERTLQGLVLADIATAQELTGRLGRLDRIDLILSEEDARRETINQSLPAGTRMEAAAARSGAVAEMTSAFRLNLTALSLLALVVGLYLIYNTMTFSVVQRRTFFGTLRCLGVTRRELFVMILSEAAIVGAVGALLGLVIGILLGRNSVLAVSQTVNDLFFTTTVQAGGIPLESLGKGFLAGLLATIITAIPPAWEAASVPPRAALSRSGLESKARRNVVWIAVGGLALILVGMGLFFLPVSNLITGFGGTFAVLIGFSMLSAIILIVLMRLITPLSGRMFGLLGSMAPRNLSNSLSRTSVAVAALMVAVGVAVGVSLMISSFRYTVEVWLEQTLQSDVYISVPSFNANRSTIEIDPQAVETLKQCAGAARVDTLRSVEVESRRGPILLLASDNRLVGTERLYADAIASPDQMRGLLEEGYILLSEPLANRLGLQARDSLELLTAGGWESFTIAGVFYDYSSSEGSALMYQPVYREKWQEMGTTAIGIHLPPNSDADQAASELRQVLSSGQRLLIRPNRELRQDVMEVFDRTFAITAALRVLATVVAFIGTLSSLLLLQLEKQREIGILRAFGLTGGQLWKLVLLETGYMGLTAGLLAMPAGYILSLILVYIINLRSFGWTLQLSLPPTAFLQALLIAIGAALLAGLYPAWRMSRMPAAQAVRYE